MQPGRYSPPWTRMGWPRADRAGLKAAAIESGVSGRPPRVDLAQRPSLLTFPPLVRGLGCRGLGAPRAGPARRPPLTQLQEPALAVRVEERMRQVIAVVLRDLKRLILDALVQVLRGTWVTASSAMWAGGERAHLRHVLEGGGRWPRCSEGQCGTLRAGGSPAAAPPGGPLPH